jgi:hypothetical protein
MSTVWRYTAMILAGSALLLVAGLYTACAGLAGSRGPRGLLETRKILRELGGEPGLAARKAGLAAMAARLRQERAAHASDGAAFGRRVEEAFAELGLELTSSSDWEPVPKLKIAGAAAFERTFTGTGPFDRLLDAVATLESWPDEVRVRELSVVRQGPGRVAFKLGITAVRSAVKEES